MFSLMSLLQVSTMGELHVEGWVCDILHSKVTVFLHGYLTHKNQALKLFNFLFCFCFKVRLNVKYKSSLSSVPCSEVWRGQEKQVGPEASALPAWGADTSPTSSCVRPPLCLTVAHPHGALEGLFIQINNHSHQQVTLKIMERHPFWRKWPEEEVIKSCEVEASHRLNCYILALRKSSI